MRSVKNKVWIFLKSLYGTRKLFSRGENKIEINQTSEAIMGKLNKIEVIDKIKELGKIEEIGKI